MSTCMQHNHKQLWHPVLLISPIWSCMLHTLPAVVRPLPINHTSWILWCLHARSRAGTLLPIRQQVQWHVGRPVFQGRRRWVGKCCISYCRRPCSPGGRQRWRGWRLQRPPALLEPRAALQWHLQWLRRPPAACRTRNRLSVKEHTHMLGSVQHSS